MPNASKFLYSDLFSQLQSAQDTLSESLGICLVLVDSRGKEMTLPSGLPITCHRLEHQCSDVHATAIKQLEEGHRAAIDTCPYGLNFAIIRTSLYTDDGGPLYLLAGRTKNRLLLEAYLPLLESLYSLPFRTPIPQEYGFARSHREKTSPSGLTSQERNVLGYLATGLSNREIAARLCISQSTVKTHVSNILTKLGLSNRTEATVYALKNGIQLGE